MARGGRVAFGQATMTAVSEIVCGRDGRIRFANDELSRLLGYHSAELIGQRAIDLIATAARPTMLEAVQSVYRTEGQQDPASMISVRTEFIHRDGWYEPALMVMSPLASARGQSALLSCSILPQLRQRQQQHQLTDALHVAHTDFDQLRLLHSAASSAGAAESLTDLLQVILPALCAYFNCAAGAVMEWASGYVINFYDVYGAATALPDSALLPARPGESNKTQIIDAGEDRHVILPFLDGRAIVLAQVPSSSLRDIGLLEIIAHYCERVIRRESAGYQESRSAQFFATVFDANQQASVLLGEDGVTIVAANEALCQLLDRNRTAVVGERLRALVAEGESLDSEQGDAPDSRSGDNLAIARSRVHLRHNNGQLVSLTATTQQVRSPQGLTATLVQFSVYSPNSPLPQLVKEQPHEVLPESADSTGVDGLTGLPQRAELRHELDLLSQERANIAVLLLDLDDFKTINDYWGHDIGDVVLRHVAGLLQSSVRPGDVVARYGGDEFAIICSAGTAVGALVAACALAERVQGLLTQPIATVSGPVSLTVSIGICDLSIPSARPAELLTRADAAMYAAKERGKNQHYVYDETLHRSALLGQQIESLLREAIAQDSIVVNYQPVVEVAAGSIVGVEALARLVDRHGLAVSPNEFIAVARRCGLITDIDSSVLRKSVELVSRLRSDRDRLLTLSVNISQASIERSDFADTTLDLLRRAALPCDALTLEFSEPDLGQASAIALQQLAVLHDAGVGIALDNFGSHDASLTQLRSGSLTRIKLDRSWVATALTDTHCADTLEATTWLADAIGLTWSASGVETMEQWQQLQKLCPGYAQGFLFSPPLSDRDLTAILGN